MIPRDAHSVPAADFRDGLADSILSVVEKAGAIFGYHASVGAGIHIAPFELLDVVGEQLHAMGIHAAQVRRR